MSTRHTAVVLVMLGIAWVLAGSLHPLALLLALSELVAFAWFASALGTWISLRAGAAMSALARAMLRAQGALVESLSFAPDERLLADGLEDHVVGVWDVESGTELIPLRRPTVALDRAHQKSQDGDHPARGGDDRVSPGVAKPQVVQVEPERDHQVEQVIEPVLDPGQVLRIPRRVPGN